MNLPSFAKKKVPAFVSILISEHSVAAAFWDLGSGVPQVKAYSNIVEWDANKEDTITQAVDTALSSLGATAEGAKQVLFGLPEKWVSGQTIAKDKKHILRAITQQLELESVGFVVASEAVIADLKNRQDANLQGIYIWVEDSSLTLSVVKRGAVEEISSVGRSESIVPDVIEGITRLKQKDIPAHITLLSLDVDTQDLKKYQQELLNFEWTDTLFSHLPTVEVLSTEQILDAVSLTGGKEVARSLGLLDEQRGAGEPAVAMGEVVTQSPMGASFEPIEPMPISDSEIPVAKPLGLVLPTPSTAKRQLLLPIVIGSVLVVLVTIGGYFALRSQVKAQVRIQAKSQEFSLPVTLTVNADGTPSDPAKNIIEGTVKTIDVSGTKEIPTTGKKNIGEKATGTVTIYNKTSQSKTFKAGTVLKEGSKRNFLTTEDVTVASASSNISETVHGKATVKVAAEKIGEEGNANKNIELTVATFDVSAFIARTESEITGGSSKTVSAVSAKDQSDVQDLVITELRKQAHEKLSASLESDERIVISDTVTPTKKTYSQEVGKESESISLTMTASASAIVYKRGDLSAFAQSKMQTELPESAQLKSEQTTLDVTSTKAINSKSVSVVGTIKGQYVSAVSGEQISKLLSGKKLEEARSFLDSQSTVGSYTISITPKFIAPLFTTLPTDTSKISVFTSVE